MLGSTILETAIGLVLVYTIFALIASGIAEYISALFDRRGEHLKHILFNLFDNDDPKGRTMLNLFVGHPMVQALNSTQWKPKFQSASEKLNKEKQAFEVARIKWSAASEAFASASAARAAAKNADAAATGATAAVATVKTALQSATSMNAAPSDALKDAVTAAQNAATAALASAAVADLAAQAAAAAEQKIATLRAPNANPPGAPAGATTPPVAPDQPIAASPDAPPAATPEPAAQPPPVTAVPQTPAAPTVPPAAARDLTPAARLASATQVVDQATKAAVAASEAATRAKKAAAAAEKAKKGLDSDLIDLVDVPKYIPDKTFADVLIHVLTAPDTIRALVTDQDPDAQPGAQDGDDANTFWDRFAAALKVVGGVASRLPDGGPKTNVTHSIEAVETTLTQIRGGAVQAVAAIGQLEKGTNELLAAVAAIPDDSLRSALERRDPVLATPPSCPGPRHPRARAPVRPSPCWPTARSRPRLQPSSIRRARTSVRSNKVSPPGSTT